MRDHFSIWTKNGTLARMHHALYVQCGEQARLQASATVGIVDSQNLKSAEKGEHSDPHGYDAGKKIRGKSRHVPVDTQG